jgi:hypothetical protein
MSLETLRGVEEIGGFKLLREELSESEKKEELLKTVYTENKYPIFIDEYLNVISFQLQRGAIKEAGINGCQVDAMIEAAKMIIEKFNEKFPCRENAIAITKLQEALFWLEARNKAANDNSKQILIEKWNKRA